MTPTLNAAKTALLREWRDECRCNLLELENKSIFVRVRVFEKIINEKTVQVNRMLCINTSSDGSSLIIKPYKHYTDTDIQCKFIENWNGLNTNQMRSIPKSLQEYENRAKNWLNGRRAINYAQTLFPEMILCAENYSKTVSKLVFGDINKLKQELYGDILLYSYISGICCGRVALYDGHHRASLICENSIKKEGNLKRLLQKYFDGDEVDTYSFPKHLQDAIDYFKNKYHEKLNQFQTQYTHRREINDDKKIETERNNINYNGDRGGNYIGSASNFRNNPLNIGNIRDLTGNINGNINGNYGDLMELPPPMNDNAMNNNNNNININNNGNGQNNMNINNNMNMMMNISNAYGLSSNSMNQYNLNMNTHRSSVGSLVNKMNNIRRRNAFLEQEIKNYREQQRLDHQRIKLLEDRICLLQRSSFHNDPISDEYGHNIINNDRSSPSTSTSLNHSTSHISNSSDDVPSYFASSNILFGGNNNNINNINDDTSTINMNNLPALPSTNNYNHNTLNNINDPMMNISNNNNNINNNNNNMNNNQCQSPMPLQTLGLNYNDPQYLPSIPITNNTNQSIFGPIGGPTDGFEFDTMDYTQPTNTSF